jgi:hypothetical protein
VCDLGNRDSAAGLFAIFVLACRLSQPAEQSRDEGVLTRVFELDFDIEQGDDLALALAHIDVSIHAGDLVDLRGNTILLGRDMWQLLVEVLARPARHVLVHPMPVVRVVENHRG